MIDKLHDPAAIERVDATEDLPVVDLLVFLMVDSMP